MGRYSTGATTVNAAQRIEMSYLIKRGYFKCFADKYGSHTQSMKWTDESSISIETVHKSNETYLRLYYTITSHHTGEKTEMDYKVFIEFIPSNLGKGNVIYFICPVSFKRCRILYRAYGSQYFKARGAYKYRLYYPAQTSSKKYQILDRFNTIKNKVEKWQNKKRMQTKFKGKPTKKAIKFEKLNQRYFDIEVITEQRIMANIYGFKHPKF
ncbi:MAG: hypothetical protein Q7U47_10780 [Paludibacter sp.]|nr:hypothetical protein [Paludibacter sp.]